MIFSIFTLFFVVVFFLSILRHLVALLDHLVHTARGTVYAPPTALYTMTNITPLQKTLITKKKSVLCNELTSYAAYRPDIKTFNTVSLRATTLY